MDKKKIVAISIGDLNGIGLELAIINHKKISKFLKPIYFIDNEMLIQGAELLQLDIPKDFQTVEKFSTKFQIQPAETSSESGKYSFLSFKESVNFVKGGFADFVMTLPINKEAWNLAGIEFKGHTDYLRYKFQQDAIMLMGVPKMYVALFTEHIPYSEVPKKITVENITTFMRSLLKSIPHLERVAVLGLNPHSGDNGVLGNEESIIIESVNLINRESGKDIFSLPLVPDIAFTKHIREQYNFYLAMYHDQGLIPLKTLYFDEVVNISLNLPIKRISVGHGTAFNIAYKKDRTLNSQSYLNALHFYFSETI